jgi:L-threonylcarbamoyladenylate synthase
VSGSSAGVEVVCLADAPATVAAAVNAALARGATIAIPTESSYGLAVDPRDERAVERVRRLKERPAERAMPVVADRLEALVALGVDGADPALAWAAARWPAALSVVVKLARPIAAAAEDGTLAVRIPGHEALRALLAALGRPLTATSANPSGEPPYLEPRALVAWLERRGAAALVVDGGRLPGGAPSTLVTWRDGAPVVLRPGRVAIA